MIDLHTHSLLSDGELLPSELIRRAEVIGYRGMAITDHADSSNLDWVLPRLVQVCKDFETNGRIRVIPGIELTHLPPALIPSMIAQARALGARLVVVHGETLAEPVPPGTNRRAILAGADILAHPGLISEEEAALAQEKGVFLEITSRKGHSISNGHVARMAEKTGALLVLDTDAHGPEDLITAEKALNVVMGAGLPRDHFRKMLENSGRILAEKE